MKVEGSPVNAKKDYMNNATNSLPPLVSIVIPAYNHERFVKQTIKSLIDQDYPNLELIVLNDGSTDNTSQSIKELTPECLKRFKRVEIIDKNNEGLTNTLNQAVRMARGEFIFHIASDDWVEPDAISSLVNEIMQDERIALACGDADFIDENGNLSSCKKNGTNFTSFVKLHTSGRADFLPERDFGSYKSLLLGNYIPIGLLVRSSIYEDVGYYPAGVMLEDLDLWLRVAKKYKIVFLNRVLAHYRIHPTNTASLYKERLLMDFLNLLIKERLYCLENSLIREWRLIMCTVLFQFVLRRKFSFFIKNLHTLGAYQFFMLSVDKLAEYLFRRSRCILNICKAKKYPDGY
jgi:alpha-1,3-rhamnosyltransferase